MNLTETQFKGITAIRIVEHVSSATLELHSAFYTFYWRCRFGPGAFVQQISEQANEDLTSLIVVDQLGQTRQLPYAEAHAEVVLGHSKFDQQTVLARFDGPVRSWVWQYAPDDRPVDKYSDSFSREGLAPYAGCASTAEHVANFRAATGLLASSAIESDSLLQYLDILERYVERWEART